LEDAGILTDASVCVTIPLAFIPALNGIGWHVANSLHNQRIVAVITLASITILNIFGVRLVALINNTGVIFEILGMVVFAFILALFHNHQGVGVIFHTHGQSLTVSTFLVAMFMSLYVIYGFDTASTLAEETKDPRREAPKAVLASVVGAFVVGAVFLWATLMAVPDMGAAIKGAFGPAQIIDANFSNAFATTYLLVVAAAIFVCCLAIQASTIRLCFGMARDEQLPGSNVLRAVHPRLHTPIGSCLAVGVLAFIPMLQYTGAAIVAIAATGMIYLSYLICNLAVIRARLRGWPRTEAPFSLGNWGIPITAVGLLWGGGMLVNFAWPRAATNPTPHETGKLLNFHWNWLNDRPVLWTVAIFIAAVGAAYFVLVQRTKPAHLQAPEGEVYAEQVPEAAPASTV